MLNKVELEAYQVGIDDLVMFKQELLDKRKAFEEENKELIERISKLSEELSVDKERIKVQAEEEFKVTGNKKLLGGIGIRVGIRINYEREKAFTWAKEHSLCLSLDERGFEKIAKTQDIDFVSKEEKLTVTFPQKIIIEAQEEELRKIKGEVL